MLHRKLAEPGCRRQKSLRRALRNAAVGGANRRKPLLAAPLHESRSGCPPTSQTSIARHLQVSVAAAAIEAKQGLAFRYCRQLPGFLLAVCSLPFPKRHVRGAIWTTNCISAQTASTQPS